MKRILAINGSYRDDGITDQAIAIMADELRNSGTEIDVIMLRDYPIEFCLNCRECTQSPGEAPGNCVQQDDMALLINKIEAADGFIFASPTNFGSVTALFKRFMERLMVYGYWPWGEHAPTFRKSKVKTKPAIIVASCAAPSLLGRFLFSTHRQLKYTAKVVGADVAGSLFTGFIGDTPNTRLPTATSVKARELAKRLI